MTTQTKEKHQVEVEGMGKSPKGTPYLTVKPWFTTSQPFNIYMNMKNPPKHNLGDVITVEKGSLIAGKDGSKAYHYYWNYAEAELFDNPQSQGSAPNGAPATGGTQPPPAPAPTAQGQAASSPAQTPKLADAKPPAPPARDETRVSIERQQSLRYAVDLMIAAVAKEKEYVPVTILEKGVLDTAAKFEAYLAHGAVPASDKEPF